MGRRGRFDFLTLPFSPTPDHSPEWRRQMRLGGHQGYSLNGRTALGYILGGQCEGRAHHRYSERDKGLRGRCGGKDEGAVRTEVTVDITSPDVPRNAQEARDALLVSRVHQPAPKGKVTPGNKSTTWRLFRASRRPCVGGWRLKKRV